MKSPKITRLRARTSTATAAVWLPLLHGCGAPAEGSAEMGVIEDSVIYGADDRVEYAGTSGRVRTWADATALLTYSSDLTCASGSCTIATTSLGLCASEKFAGQPVARDGDCTAFLVAPDRFVTAGHCIAAGPCTDRRIVFGFTGSGATANTVVPQSDVYSCIGVITDSGAPDYAVIRVDRPVTGRVPYWVRYVDKVPDGQPLTLIGHPSALPLKIDGGGSVKTNSSATSFEASVDSFHGNSGSPVVNNTTGVLEGILVAGNPDYTWSSSAGCYTTNSCSESGGCPGFETITRITQLSQYIPLHPAGIVVATTL